MSYAVLASEPPRIGILAQHVIGAASFTLPVLIIPWTTHGRHILQPRDLSRELLQFIVVSELPGAAGPVQQEELVLAGELALFPIFVQGAHVAYERRNTGNRADQQVIGAPALGVERKPPLGDFAHEQFIALLQFVK